LLVQMSLPDRATHRIRHCRHPTAWRLRYKSCTAACLPTVTVNPSLR